MEIIKAFFQNWDRIHNVTLKLIQQVPEDKLDFKPTEKNFTLRELIHHIYNAEETITVLGKEKGEITIEDFKNPRTPVTELKSVEDLYNYAKKVHENTNKGIAEMSQEKLMAEPIKTIFGTYSYYILMNMLVEHILHHRGQMYIYLRMCGVENLVPTF